MISNILLNTFSTDIFPAWLTVLLNDEFCNFKRKKVPNSFGETSYYSKAHDASMGNKKIACLNFVIKSNVGYRSSFQSTFTLGVFNHTFADVMTRF